MSTKELAQTYRAEILSRHLTGVEADKVLRQAILTKLEQTRLTGQLISDAAGDLPNGQFEQATDFLSKPAISAYLKFARSNPEPITDLENALHAIRLALQVSGTLEFGGHGIQHRHRSNFFSSCESAIQGMSAAWFKFIRENPLKRWRVETLESLYASLRPIAKIIQAVADELKHRQ